uniref:Uncharacterized protein n=1 Tax=Oryza glumipatula TaxID=40148 RepID=A0A0D9ZHK3_9ORYZ
MVTTGYFAGKPAKPNDKEQQAGDEETQAVDAQTPGAYKITSWALQQTFNSSQQRSNPLIRTDQAFWPNAVHASRALEEQQARRRSLAVAPFVTSIIRRHVTRAFDRTCRNHKEPQTREAPVEAQWERFARRGIIFAMRPKGRHDPGRLFAISGPAQEANLGAHS